MLMRVLSLLLITWMVSGCARHQKPEVILVPLTALAPTSCLQTHPLPAFNQVVVQGRVNVSLHTGYARPEVLMRGDPRDLTQAIIEVHNNTLLINLGEGYPRYGAVSAEIRGHFLNGFIYKGAGTITGTRLYSGLLNLSIDNPGNTTLAGNICLGNLVVKGNGTTRIDGVNATNLQLSMIGKPRVQMTGVARLNSLNLSGDGWFSLYWIKSDALKIRARNGTFLQLAGIVNKLDVELWDNAQFKGRYLRASRAFIKTHDHAIAELSAIKRQHTLATDASDIYFYNIPEMKTDYMAYNGAVLDMRDWHVYALQEYDRYSK